MSDICIPDDTDWSCRFTEESLEQYLETEGNEAKIERAEAFAWSLLAALTNYRIGTCPITVRPCRAACAPPGSWIAAPVGRGSFAGAIGTIGGWSPHITGGRWVNACGCGTGDCGCSSLSEAYLPGPVGRVLSVWLDGVELPKTAYRVLNGNRLVRVDGEDWPACQDQSLDDQQGFSVTYYRGAAPNAMTRAAAGALADEFLKSCDGDETCRLPGNLTRMTGAGQSYEFDPQDFATGDLGIPEVTAVIRIYNPNNLRSPVIVASPDVYATPTMTAGRR